MPESRSMAAWLRSVLSDPHDELGAWERALRYPYDLARYFTRQLREDRAPQMASALAFRTLFALLPVMVVGGVMVRAFKGSEWLLDACQVLFKKLELDTMTVAGATGEAAVASGESLSTWLLNLIGQSQKINIAAIGWVGMAVVIFSAIWLMVTIERCFNTVYRAPEGRPWVRRFTVYWSVLTLGPLAMGLTIWSSGWIDRKAMELEGWIEIARWLQIFWGFVVTWLMVCFFYKTVPNTNVAIRPALVGAFVAALLVELGKRGLGLYFHKAVSLSQLYGSLGLIPVFMFWVYVMWLFMLLGLEVSATLQSLRGRRLQEMESRRGRGGLVDPAAVLIVMQVIARHFAASRVTTSRDVADESGLPESTVAIMLEHLVEANFLHRLDTGDGAVTLARPPEQIPADQLIEIGFRMVDEGGADNRPALLDHLRDAQKNVARKATLATLAH